MNVDKVDPTVTKVNFKIDQSCLSTGIQTQLTGIVIGPPSLDPPLTSCSVNYDNPPDDSSEVGGTSIADVPGLSELIQAAADATMAQFMGDPFADALVATLNGCPCFIQGEVDEIVPVGNCYFQCNYETIDPAGDLLTNIFGTTAPLHVAQVIETGTGATCFYNDPVVTEPRFFSITVEQAQGCKQMIQNTQDTLGLCAAPIGTCIP